METRQDSPPHAGAAGAAWSEAKEAARARIDEHKQAAAEGVSDFAGALRRAAGESTGDTAASFAQHAADGLERISSTLRRKDVDTMLRELQGFARAQPALFLGVSVAAGFLAVRFLKSGAAATQPQPQPASSGADGAMRMSGAQAAAETQYTESF